MAWLGDDDFLIPFTDATKDEGQRLHEEGDVSLLESCEGDFYEAHVRFFRRHHAVWLERKDGGCEHECTCAWFENEGSGCAHLWALVLASNQTRRTDEWGDDGPPAIIPTWLMVRARKRVRLAARWTGEADDEGGERPLLADAEHLERVTDPRDVALIKLLEPIAGGRRNLLDGGGFMDPDGPWEIPPESRAEVLQAAARTERLFFETSDEKIRPLVIDDDVATHDLLLGFDEDEAVAGRLRLAGWLIAADDTRRALDDADLLIRGAAPVAVLDGRLVKVETFGADEWLTLLAKGKTFPVDPDETASVMERLATSGPLPRIALSPDTPPLPLERTAPIGRAVITRMRRDLVCDLKLRYGPQELPPESGARCVLDVARGCQWSRDLDGEAALASRLDVQEGLLPDEGVYGRWWVDPDRFEDVAADLLEAGFEVIAEDRPYRQSGAPALLLSSGLDWFDLEGGVSFEGAETVSLPRLVAALRAGKRFVDLADGGRGLLPAAWLEKVRGVLELGRTEGDAVRFSRAQALMLEPLAESGDVDASTGDLVALRDALSTLAEPPEHAAPSRFGGELRPYQHRGLGWLRTLSEARLGGCLADDMGLGKTVQVLAFLQSLGTDPIEGVAAAPVLIVVPRSLLWNWQREAARFTPDLDVYIHHGPKRRRDAPAVSSTTLVLTTYGTLQRDLELFAAVPWAVVVLDESQAVKNPRSKNALAVRTLQAAVRVSLTGTPVENHARDLWSQMEFLNPGLLGTEKRFLEMTGAGGDGGTRALLARALRPLILRRTKEEVAPDLPDRIEQTVLTPMGDEQEALYARLRDESARSLGQRVDSEGIGGLKLHVLEALLRLRQVACHPGLVDPALRGAASGKIDLLCDELSQVAGSGHKALVFSQFTGLLGIVRERLDAEELTYAYLDGKTRDREAPVTRFQEDAACPLFLISLKAGGHGLNLTAADYVFLLDPWWNPAVEAQAIDRAHRIGRKSKVVAYRLVARGTVEERILELQQRKRELADALLAETEGPLGSLTEEDLRLLLG
ncbi:MAG: hypothetical protein CMJ83_18645 [Planctomycetes bacterium]|nr:hypothetical protein [Planctomycetota bacterium]